MGLTLVKLLLTIPLLLLVAGCGFEKRSSAYSCTPEQGCAVDRVCVEGWCVLAAPADIDSGQPRPDGPIASDANTVDATIPSIDAAPLPDAFVSACDLCEGSACNESCEGAACSFQCPIDSCSCDFNCNDQSCDTSCGPNVNCNIDCSGPGNCNATCESASICAVDCTGADKCDKIRCRSESECLIQCIGAETCGFFECSGGVTNCADNIIVCNRPCPI